MSMRIPRPALGSYAVLAPALVLAGLLDTGCAPQLACGPGTELRDGVCRPKVTGTPDAGTAPTDGGEPGDGGGACTPYCTGRECGDDGCGGSCGSCSDAERPECDTGIGRCVAVCVPRCDTRNCGDDGCGGSCGTCADGSSCGDTGRCVADAWTCDPLWFAAGDTCDCSCGAYDPDCDRPSRPVAGCAPGERCDATGRCVSPVPAGWTCPVARYGGNEACDCGCGSPDPDCAFDDLPVAGCPGDAPRCNTDGTCAACTPQCEGKTCGSDGCGGNCGACDPEANLACVDGACVSACEPEPVACRLSECGEDGCGGSCGTCAANAVCQSGRCVVEELPPDPQSCAGRCGSIAPSGCACTTSCATAGTCCRDYAAQCTCLPDCTGKTCGPDGCGGSCGTCSGATPFCEEGTCRSACTPRCDGLQCGNDGCGGSCGTCGADSVCAWTGLCVPTAWRCPVGSYGDRAGCDCSCGAQDPDCLVDDSYVFGCPTPTTACSATGTCEVTFCGANADCGAQWCTGVYYEGNGRYRGTCAAPVSTAKSPGSGCASDGECASEVCAGDRCRLYCRSDASCPGNDRCVAIGRRSSPGAAVNGFVGVCTTPVGTGAPCTSQASCTTPGESCTAHIDPTTFGARYLCTSTPRAIGASCAAGSCEGDQTCAILGGAARCTLPCPGGASDCPSGWRCGSTTLHNAGTSTPADDPTVPVCVPN